MPRALMMISLRRPRLASSFIDLVDGPTLPADVIGLALDLESRGFHVYRSEEKLTVARHDGEDPDHLLSEADRVSIRKWKLHLLELYDYVARREVEQEQKARTTKRSRTARTGENVTRK